MTTTRAFRAGGSVEDFCRACKLDRMHTIVVVDGDGQPLRVTCGYCGSEHNYRGGPRTGAPAAVASSRVRDSASAPGLQTEASAASPAIARSRSGAAFPVVADRERRHDPVSVPDMSDDLELLLRRVIREEAGVSAVVPADKWRGGTLVLKPGTPGLQEKAWPIETFFHKVVMVRNRLRTLEQQVNASDLPEDAKVKLQSYVTGCYGSLTSFNVLFADDDDQFKGSGE
jgi:hypothetical protein